tara:strand:- start:829 stop:1092 length:264 start_codon:yes stop_codon:yes gene_type:complete
MLKELKYLFYLIVICLFFFLTIKYYFSDQNHKNYFNSISIIDKKLNQIDPKLPFLKNDTENIIEFVELKSDKKSKNHSFWKLIFNDE